jgi:flavorubredoxin
MKIIIKLIDITTIKIFQEKRMTALVIYDSVFGNTETIAREIGESLGAKVVKVDTFRRLI